MKRITVQGYAPEPRTTQVAVDQPFPDDPFPGEEYNLAESNPEAIPPDDIGRLRDDWITARNNGNPLYVVGEDGRMFYVAVGGDGKAITLHSVVPRYEVQEGTITEYAGPDAFFTLEEQLGRYQPVPMQQIVQSNIEGHVATVSNPIWFKAVKRLVQQHMGQEVYNPYKK